MISSVLKSFGGTLTESKGADGSPPPKTCTVAVAESCPFEMTTAKLAFSGERPVLT